MASIDNFYTVITFFGLAIFFLTMMVAWNEFSGLNDELWDQSSVGDKIKTNAQNAVNTFDFVLIIVYFGLHLGILVTAFLLRTHPVIYLVSIFLIAILAMLAAPLANAYDDVIAEPELNTVSEDIPITNFVLRNLPQFEVIWGFITAFCLFGFARWEGII